MVRCKEENAAFSSGNAIDAIEQSTQGNSILIHPLAISLLLGVQKSAVNVFKYDDGLVHGRVEGVEQHRVAHLRVRKRQHADYSLQIACQS